VVQGDTEPRSSIEVPTCGTTTADAGAVTLMVGGALIVSVPGDQMLSVGLSPSLTLAHKK
jgi:hypothetical protein